eukprot:1161779-Pelagomonas_calceolata.AAC.5
MHTQRLRRRGCSDPPKWSGKIRQQHDFPLVPHTKASVFSSYKPLGVKPPEGPPTTSQLSAAMSS